MDTNDMKRLRWIEHRFREIENEGLEDYVRARLHEQAQKMDTDELDERLAEFEED